MVVLKAMSVKVMEYFGKGFKSARGEHVILFTNRDEQVIKFIIPIDITDCSATETCIFYFDRVKIESLSPSF
jgi:hypothetical protein